MQRQCSDFSAARSPVCLPSSLLRHRPGAKVGRRLFFSKCDYIFCRASDRLVLFRAVRKCVCAETGFLFISFFHLGRNWGTVRRSWPPWERSATRERFSQTNNRRRGVRGAGGETWHDDDDEDEPVVIKEIEFEVICDHALSARSSLSHCVSPLAVPHCLSLPN